MKQINRVCWTSPQWSRRAEPEKCKAERGDASLHREETGVTVAPAPRTAEVDTPPRQGHYPANLRALTGCSAKRDPEVAMKPPVAPMAVLMLGNERGVPGRRADHRDLQRPSDRGLSIGIRPIV